MKLFHLYLALGIVSCCAFASINQEISVKKVERTVDISSQLVRILAKLTLENKGKGSIQSFLYSIEPNTKDKLAFFGAFTKKSGDDSENLYLDSKIIAVPAHKDKTFWEVKLQNPLEAGKSTRVDVETVFTHHLIPHPSQITQNDKQLLLYTGNHYFYTPYSTVSQTTTVTLPSASTESYTKLKPVSQNENNLVYGPYDNVPPFSQNEMVVHSENNSPFLTVTNLLRVIEVSHWGNIAVEESVDVRHTGAALKGSFSRYDYQREQTGSSSVRSFKTVLPASASDVYYRDEIGNISTSHLRTLEDAVEVDIRPRFPLFGGWKTHYLLGYNIPSYEYLYNYGNEFVLKIRFVDHIFDDMVIDDAEVKFILPEGAWDIHVDAPYQIERRPDETHFSYLDTSGRPVVVARKSNLVENHIQDIEIRYKYQKILMLHEPLLVVIAFYLLFVIVIIYVRLDFSITKDEVSESKMRAAGYCEKVQSQQDKLLSIYQQYDDVVSHYKSGKDHAAFQAAVKKLIADQKMAAQAITDLHAKLKPDAPDSAEKVSELQKLDRQLKDLAAAQVTYAEKLISSKMNKQQYLENESTNNKKKKEVVDKIDSIVTSL